MDNVLCSCLKCGSELGSFRNSWIGIGNSYFSPMHPPVTHVNGFETTGDVFERGPDGSAVENSVLQDLACRKCATVVGLRCDDAPAGHLLKKNQLILRLAEMRVISENTGSKAVISVQQKIPLLAPGTEKLPAVRRATTVQPTPRHRTPISSIEDSKRTRMSGSMPPPMREIPGRVGAKMPDWAEDAMNSQQKDIDRVSGAVARIEKDMKSFREFMQEVRAELAANRATRKTQQDLNQEQLGWLQEDLKELTQEHDNLQQDLRKEELPSIRNELEELRQEIDSNERITALPDFNSLLSIDGFKNLTEDVMRINRKSDEVDELKKELHRLQKRLTDMEEKRQDSFVFPKTLMKAPRTPRVLSQPEARMRNVRSIALQQPALMFEATADNTAMLARDASPGLYPPGAFPDSIIDHNDFPLNTIDNAAEQPPAATGSRPQRSARALEVAETVSPGLARAQKWCYTGLRRWQSVKGAFQAFDLEYPKAGVPQSIKILEDHVNKSNLQKSASALKFGEVAISGENNEDFEAERPGDQDEPKSTLPKRKHDQFEGRTSRSENMRKKRRRSGRAVEEEKSAVPSRSERSERRTPIIIPSDNASPELGRETRFRSSPEEENRTNHESEAALQPLPNILRVPRPPESATRSSKDLCANNGEPISSNGRPLRSQQTAPEAENDAPATEAVLPSIEAQDTATPRTTIPNHLLLSSAPSSATSNSGLARPYFCGACKKTYKNIGGLRYHKEHSSCEDHEEDIIPAIFTCPSCSSKLMSYEGLKYHVLHSPACKRSEDADLQAVIAAWEEQYKNSKEARKLAEKIQRLALLAAGKDDPSKPFKCGACGKRYNSSGGLKYHKKHSSCEGHEDDVISPNFKCPSCSKELKQEGLAYHISNSLCGKTPMNGKKKNVGTAIEADEEQKRKAALAARERLVTETLERL